MDQIDKIRASIFRTRFQHELDYLLKNLDKNLDEERDEEQEEAIHNRISQLKQILENHDKEQEEKNKDTIQEINDLVYKKAWNRLPVFHRIVKFKEYISSTDLFNKKQKKFLLKEGLRLLEDKKWGTKKYVEYDSSNCKILSIPAIKIDEDTGEITI